MSDDPDVDLDIDIDLPAVGVPVDLSLASRTDTFLCWVEGADDDLVVTAAVDHELRPIGCEIGERVDVVWRDTDELRSLPTELVGIEKAERPCWRLRAVGVTKRGQRRDAVRAPVTLPVRVRTNAGLFPGDTVDLSEGGLRCLLDRPRPVAPRLAEAEDARAAVAAGDVVGLAVTLASTTFTCRAEVTRRFPRDDARVELSLRFIGLSERDQDDIRREVFSRLRELRRRGLL